MEGPHQVFVYTDRDFVRDARRCSDGKTRETRSRFDVTLRSGWAEKMARGLFRYRLGELETRVLPGEAGYVAQLNVQRGVARRRPQEIRSLRQGFDPTQFNFNRVAADEVLFELRGAGGAPCPVIINASPLESGHSLLVPEPARCHPQVLTPAAARVGIESVLLSADPAYRVGFNSLGAFASVNHLHLHAYYLDHALRVEWAPVAHVHAGLYRLGVFPRAFVFYTEGQDTGATAEAVCALTDALADRDVAHNVFMCRGCAPGGDDAPAQRGPCALRRGVRVFVWPRASCFGAKEESAFNVALCELAGHLPFKNSEDFHSIDEDGVKAIVRRYVLSEREFSQLEEELVEKLYPVNSAD